MCNRRLPVSRPLEGLLVSCLVLTVMLAAVFSAVFAHFLSEKNNHEARHRSASCSVWRLARGAAGSGGGRAEDSSSRLEVHVLGGQRLAPPLGSRGRVRQRNYTRKFLYNFLPRPP